MLGGSVMSEPRKLTRGICVRLSVW